MVRKTGFECAAGSSRNLGRNQDYRSGSEMRSATLDSVDYWSQISYIVVVDGSVVTDPKQIGVFAGKDGIARKLQTFALKSLTDELHQARLEQWRLSNLKLRDHGGIKVKTDD